MSLIAAHRRIDPSSRKITLSRAQILMYLIAIVFGIIVGSFGTNRLQYNHLSTLVTMFQGKHCISDTNHFSAFLMKKYFADAYTQSLPILSQHNLVISIAIKLNLTSLYQFSRSLRATCASCTLVLAVNNVTMHDNDFKELAHLYSIVYISFDEYVPANLRADQQVHTNLMSARFIVINNYLLTLQAKGEVYDNVFICDSHDVLFQTNIFAHMTAYTPGLYAFMEDGRMTIGTCQFNSDWIKTCFGDVELQNLFNESISCAGTVLGTWSAILSYLSVMESQMLNASGACKNIGMDQGTHNYIIHNRKVPNVTIHHISHEYGFVGTLGYVLWMKRNQFGLVQNKNESIYAVIHQWNRSQRMTDQFQREYQLIPPNMRDGKN